VKIFANDLAIFSPDPILVEVLRSAGTFVIVKSLIATRKIATLNFESLGTGSQRQGPAQVYLV